MKRHLARVTHLALLLSVCALAAPELAPQLRLVGIIGDARGKSQEPVHLAINDGGQLLVLLRNGRIMVFGPDGLYQRSLRVGRQVSATSYLACRGKRILVGDWRTDFPWVFEERRQGREAGRFLEPGQVVTDDTLIVVADRGNQRLQLFSREDTATPAAILELEVRPEVLALHGDLMLVADDQRQLSIYKRTGGTFALNDSLKTLDGATSVCLGADGSIYVAYQRGLNQSVRQYARQEGTWQEQRIIAPSLYSSWLGYYPDAAPLVTGPDDQVWFGADLYGAILSFDPATGRIAERFRGTYRPRAVGFDADGQIYVGGYVSAAKVGPSIERFTAEGKALGSFGPTPLFPENGTPIWGLLPAPDGSVYVRIIEQGWRKGWPAYTLKRVQTDGKMETILDLGSLYAVRTRFSPSGSSGNLSFDQDGNLVVAATMYAAVMKLTPDGEVIWEASQFPRNADEIAFGSPVDVAVDSRNNIWVADAKRDAIICLSSTGKHLLTWGGFADIDQRDGKGFSSPSGVAVTTTGGQEFLIVGDAGNHQLVQYALSNGPRPPN